MTVCADRNCTVHRHCGSYPVFLAGPERQRLGFPMPSPKQSQTRAGKAPRAPSPPFRPGQRGGRLLPSRHLWIPWPCRCSFPPLTEPTRRLLFAATRPGLLRRRVQPKGRETLLSAPDFTWTPSVLHVTAGPSNHCPSSTHSRAFSALRTSPEPSGPPPHPPLDDWPGLPSIPGLGQAPLPGGASALALSRGSPRPSRPGSR